MFHTENAKYNRRSVRSDLIQFLFFARDFSRTVMIFMYPSKNSYCTVNMWLRDFFTLNGNAGVWISILTNRQNGAGFVFADRAYFFKKRYEPNKVIQMKWKANRFRFRMKINRYVITITYIIPKVCKTKKHPVNGGIESKNIRLLRGSNR